MVRVIFDYHDAELTTTLLEESGLKLLDKLSVCDDWQWKIERHFENKDTNWGNYWAVSGSSKKAKAKIKMKVGNPILIDDMLTFSFEETEYICHLHFYKDIEVFQTIQGFMRYLIYTYPDKGLVIIEQFSEEKCLMPPQEKKTWMKSNFKRLEKIADSIRNKIYELSDRLDKIMD